MTINPKEFTSKDNILITIGDPTGIGIEIILKALYSEKLPRNLKPLIIGCRKTLKITYQKLKEKGILSLVNPDDVAIIDLPLVDKIKIGHPCSKSGEASIKWIIKATQILKEGKARSLVTAPIAKHAWYAAGYKYPGQTELLTELTRSKNTSMMFTAISPINKWRLNTLLTTTHIPFSRITAELTPQIVTNKLNTLLEFCTRFKEYPYLAIAGLNPHAGEKGQLGNEELEWLIPLLHKWRAKHPKITLDGPLPPDTCWLPAAKSWQGSKNIQAPDGYLALYHDQGLIAVKLLAFERAVNTTLGLPFIRTSPDHGTACDIAGKGIANPESMIAAINTAWDLSN